MSVAKVTEIIASSEKGFEDAIKVGLKRADKTLNGIKSAWVANQQVTVNRGNVKEFRVTLKVTFVLSD